MGITNVSIAGCIPITTDFQVSFSQRLPYLSVDLLPFEPLISVHQAIRLIIVVLIAIVGYRPQWIYTSSGALI